MFLQVPIEASIVGSSHCPLWIGLKKISIDISSSITVLLVARRTNEASDRFSPKPRIILCQPEFHNGLIQSVCLNRCRQQADIVRICQNCHRHCSFSTLRCKQKKNHVRVIMASCSLRNSNSQAEL